MSSSPDAGNSASNTTNTPSLGVILGHFVQSSNDIITDRARLLAAAPTSDPDASASAHGSQISAGSLTHINPAVAKRLIKAAANKTYSSELLRHMAGPITTMTTAMKEMYSTDGDTAAASIAYFLGTELALGAERIATKKLMTQFLDQPALHPSAPRTNGHLNAFERMCGTTIESLGENSLMTAASRILDLTAAAKKAEDDMRAAAVLSALSSADPKWRDELARQIVEGRRYDPDLEPSYMTFGPGATAQDIATQLQLAAEQLKASMDPEQNLQVAGAGKQFFKSAEMALDNAVEKLVEERVERLTSNAAETDTAASSCRALASTSDPKGKGKDVAVQPARDEMDDIHDRALRDQEAACKLSELNQSVKALSAALAKMAAGASKVVGEDGTVSIEAFLQVMRDRSQDDSGLGEATQEANKIHFRQSARVTALALASLCIPDNPEQRQFSVDLLEGIRKMDREVWPNRVPPLDAQYLVPLSELEDEAGAAQDHSKRKREKSSSGASVNTEDLRRGGRESSEDASPVRQRTAQEIWEERRAQLLKDDPEYLKLPAESAPAVATDLQETESESEDGSSSDPGTPPKVSSPQKADSPKTDDDGASIAMSLEPPESADEEIETQAVAPAASKTLLEQVEAAISTERSQARQYLLDALSGAKVSQSKQIEKGSAEGAGSGRIGG